jgi:predicted dehydrogenase
MTLLRVGIIGLGVGEQHLLAYRQLAECAVVALCDFSEDKLQNAREKYGNLRVTVRAQDILADPEIDLVSLASFDDDHAGQTLAALKAGKHVFVEKPLCRSLEELALIKQAWREKPNLKLTSNLVLRSAPLYEWLLGLVRAGDLGRIYAIDGDYLYGRLEKISLGWRKEVPDYSVMQGGGIHLLDLMLRLAGEKPEAVNAMGNRICTAGSEFRYQDYVTATFRFPGGLVGRITANFGCVHRHQHVLRVFGTKGTFIYDDQGPRYHVSRDPALAAATVNLPALPASKGALIKPFVRDILADRDLSPAIQAELDLISACVAADQALTTGQVEKVEYV